MSFRVTSQYTWSRALLNAMLSALKTVPSGALMTPVIVRLFTSGPTPTPDSLVSDFTACTYSGYGDATVTLTTGVNATPDIQAAIASPVFIATTTATFTSDVAQGYILFNGSTTFWGGETFSAPVNFGLNGDFLDLDLVLPVADQQISGQ